MSKSKNNKFNRDASVDMEGLVNRINSKIDTRGGIVDLNPQYQGFFTGTVPNPYLNAGLQSVGGMIGGGIGSLFPAPFNVIAAPVGGLIGSQIANLGHHGMKRLTGVGDYYVYDRHLGEVRREKGTPYVMKGYYAKRGNKKGINKKKKKK